MTQHVWEHPTSIISLACYLSLITISGYMIIFSQGMLPRLTKGTSEKSGQVWAWLDMSGHTQSNESSSLAWYLSLVNISMEKIKDIDALLSEILMIKEYCNHTGWEHFGLYNLSTKIFPGMQLAQEKRAAMSFVLVYFQKKAMTKCYEK